VTEIFQKWKILAKARLLTNNPELRLFPSQQLKNIFFHKLKTQLLHIEKFFPTDKKISVFNTAQFTVTFGVGIFTMDVDAVRRMLDSQAIQIARHVRRHVDKSRL